MSERIMHVSAPILFSDLLRLKAVTGQSTTMVAVQDAIAYRIAAGKKKKEE